MEVCAIVKEKNPITSEVSLQLFVRFKERKSKIMRLKTEIDTDGVPSLSLEANLNNIYGDAKQLHFDVQFKEYSHIKTTVSLNGPIISDPDKRWSFSFLNDGLDWSQNGIREITSTFNPSISFTTKYGHHVLGHSMSWRETKIDNTNPARLLLENCGHSFKNSVDHTFVQDTRNRKIFSSTGHIFKMFNQLSGLVGDVSQFKNTFYYQKNWSFPALSGVTFSAVLNTGFIQNFGGKNTNIIDRFFIGGYNNLRGFKFNSVGASIHKKYIGGDFFATSGAYLHLPIPFTSSEFQNTFKLQAFMNSGLVTSPKNGLIKQLKSIDYNSLNCSIGCGLVANVANIIRLEINYCHPIKVQTGAS
ncbi:Sorting and assembly machinery component 50 A [Thelohanellus kitauei]|uniref:Sorting and assembly machinery component 50 A n=1 Tax=Thelohanellus kitauei TaxID=669202 RepID=A0A0C2MEZ3_THEKT|nr:Sorting and assembly machinery component 50 A [Thelohanellus kitauei]